MGSALLILAAWLWRKELGISSLGPLSEKEDIADDLEPKDSEENNDEGSPNDTNASIPTSSNQLTFYENERKTKLLQLVKTHHYLSTSKASVELGISIKSAQSTLFSLFAEDKIDRSEYRGKEIFLDKDFWENKAIDWVVKQLSKIEKIESVYKQVRYKTASFDAIAETAEKVFFIEITSRPERVVSRIVRDSVEFEHRYKKHAYYIVAAVCIEGKNAPAPIKTPVKDFEFWNVPSEVAIIPQKD